MGNDQGKAAGASATPAGIQSMDESLQKKFSKGIQFNMKIVLKGDRNTGKTCLFDRMAGKPFQDAYLPTTEIQVASILWSYKVTSDTVKVEVWDVVDKGKVQKKQTKGGLKLFNTTPDEEDDDEEEGEGGKKVLDASFLNVYKGCNGVVIMFDMTKMWTWKYVERELPKVPVDIPVILLANFRDLGEHRVVTRDEILTFVKTARPDGSSEVMYAESSMKNAFGLMHLHKFLNIPFLQMQQDMLLQQIQVSREQMLAARDELITASSTEDQNYDMFLGRLQQAAEQRKKKAQQLREENSDLQPGDVRGMDPEQSSLRSSSSASSSAHQQTTPTPARVTERQPSGGKKSKFPKFLSSSRNKQKDTEPSRDPIPVSPCGTSVGTADIEEFVPEGDVDSFLEETEEGEEEEDLGRSEEESDSDGQPMVAKDEDLSSHDDEEEATPPTPPKPVSQEPSPVVRRDRQAKPLKSAKEVELTESEEEEEEKEEEQTVPRSLKKEKQKDLQLFWGKETARDGPEEVVSKPKPKSGGLLLEWRVPEPEVKKEKGESGEVGEGRKERRKRSSKKGSSRRKKEAAASNGATTAPTASDPFGVGSLEAWLDSEDILQPTAVSGGGRGRKGEEMGEDVGESESTSHHHKRSKKPRERSSTADSGSSKHKKKHKSRNSAKEADLTF